MHYSSVADCASLLCRYLEPEVCSAARYEDMCARREALSLASGEGEVAEQVDDADAGKAEEEPTAVEVEAGVMDESAKGKGEEVMLDERAKGKEEEYIEDGGGWYRSLVCGALSSVCDRSRFA